MKQILATITVAVTLVASSASAFDPADLKKLKETNECATEFEICFNAIATVEKLTLDDWITSKIAAKINNE